jgi:hypothetical protein
MDGSSHDEIDFDFDFDDSALHKKLGLSGFRRSWRMRLEALLLEARHGLANGLIDAPEGLLTRQAVVSKTKSRSTESRGMSRMNRLIAVPPLSANVSSTSTSGATCVSSRAVSR